MGDLIDSKKQFNAKRVKDKINYSVHDVLGAEAYTVEEEYKIIDNKKEAQRLQSEGWTVETITMYVCMKI